MTILQAFGILNEHFNQKHSFRFSKNKKDLLLITEDEAADDAALTCALKEMEAASLLKSAEINGETIWTLIKPFESIIQNVEINYLIAAGIASVINKACEDLGNNEEKCDPKNITDKDFKNLLFIASKASVESLKE